MDLISRNANQIYYIYLARGITSTVIWNTYTSRGTFFVNVTRIYETLYSILACYEVRVESIKIL